MTNEERWLDAMNKQKSECSVRNFEGNEGINERWARKVAESPLDILNDRMADALVEMVGTVAEEVYTGFATTTNDQLAIITEAAHLAANLTLNVLDDYACLHPFEVALDEPVTFDFIRLQDRFNRNYADAINS